MLQQINYSNYPKTANEENYIPANALALINLFREYANGTESFKIEIEERFIKDLRSNNAGEHKNV